MNRFQTLLRTGLYIGCLWLLLPQLPVQAQPPLPPDNVEHLAITFLNAAARQEWQTAAPALQSLKAQYPDFRPLPLLQALAEQRTAVMLAAPVAITPETDEFVPDNLQAELLLRWQYRAPAEGLYPRQIIRLDPHQPHLFLVDLEKARLYLYANSNGELRKLADYYSGIGKQGIGKQVEGDHRTPVGVYTFTEYLSDARLPELYGAGALTLDYPNRWDRRLKRTGSNIWLHGVPRATYSRTPRSSRGCVTVSNFIFDALRYYALPGQTPIVLADRLEWQTAAQVAQQRLTFDALLEKWRTEQEKQAATLFSLQDVEMYFYPGEKNLVQMKFKQTAGSGETAKQSGRTLFWQLQADNNWKVVYEK
jgi:hypothetical protein